jgi:hypothetical protein
MYQYVLGFPDKADQWAELGPGWTPAELNHILAAHVVDSAVTTFGCVELESQLFRGVQLTIKESAEKDAACKSSES